MINKRDEFQVERSISRLIIHQDFDDETKTYDSDIALLRLNFQVSYDLHIRPICLPEYPGKYSRNLSWLR